MPDQGPLRTLASTSGISKTWKPWNSSARRWATCSDFSASHPVAAAHDLHPNYLSTRFALEESGLKTIAVQHHHAHIASCMADNGLRGRVIGVALDGTGYGLDGRIWGGEFLTCSFAGFERRGHLRYVPLAGGDSAIRQPWRSALAYLRAAFGPQATSLALPMFEEIPAHRHRRSRNDALAKCPDH